MRAPTSHVHDRSWLITAHESVEAPRPCQHAHPGCPRGHHGQLDALTRWIDNLPEPAPIPPVDALAAARGRVLFERPDVGCADCHAGPRLGHTGESTDVGTDGQWQVPGLLGIAQRLPLMHNGCATSLHARFEPSCGGTAHGDTAHLAPAELDDLVSYLESL